MLAEVKYGAEKEISMNSRGFAVTILTLGLFLSVLAADLKSEPRSRHHFLNFSIFYPVSINQSRYDTTNINLTLIYGRVGQVHGIDLAGGISVVENDVKGFQVAGLAGFCGSDFTGLQLAGLFAVGGEEFSGFQVSGLLNVCGEEFKGCQGSGLLNVTGNNFKGIQTTAIFNIVGEECQGLQMAGLMNITGNAFQGIQATGGWNIAGESSQGIQASGLFNVTGERFKGVQASGIFNITGEDCTGLQAGGIFSVTGGMFKGLQFSGGFNVAGERLSGLQVGTANVAGTSQGLQIGLLNAAEDMDGVQIGLVNYSRNTKGVPIGLANISKHDGRIRWTSWASNLTGANSGVKFMIRRIYSLVSLGSFNLYSDINECLAYSAFYGYSFPAGHFSIDTDIGYMHIDNAALFQGLRGDPDQRALMLRASLNRRLSSRLALFAGGGLSSIKDRDAPAGSSELRPFFFAGLDLF